VRFVNNIGLCVVAIARESSKCQPDRWWSLDAIRGVCLVVSVFFTSYVLYADTRLPFSIRAIWEFIGRCFDCPHNFRIAIVGILPVYVALMVFGGGCLGLLTGYVFHLLVRRFRR